MDISRIKELCDGQEISIPELEIRVGLSPRSIGRWVTSAPSYDKVVKVANFFNVSTDYICGNTDNKESPNEKDETIVYLQRFKQSHPEKNEKINSLIQSALALLEND